MTKLLNMSHESLRSPAKFPVHAPTQSSDTGHTESEALHEVSNIMRELHTLLENYAPAWYSQQHHNRTKLAIRKLDRIQSLGPVLVR